MCFMLNDLPILGRSNQIPYCIPDFHRFYTCRCTLYISFVYLDLIIQPFNQLEGATKKSNGSTYCKQIVLSSQAFGLK